MDLWAPKVVWATWREYCSWSPTLGLRQEQVCCFWPVFNWFSEPFSDGCSTSPSSSFFPCASLLPLHLRSGGLTRSLFSPSKYFLLLFELVLSCPTSLGMENKLFLFYKSKMLFSCPFPVWFPFVSSFPWKWDLLISLELVCVWAYNTQF